MRIRFPLWSLPVVIAGVLCALSPVLRADDTPAATDQGKDVTIYLGNVEVRGEAKIGQTLQAIKIALEMPYSSDPKFANVLVCRLEDKPGSHLYKILICGTNRNLASQRFALQTAFDLMNSRNASDRGEFGGVSCAPGCYDQVFGALNETIDGMPDHYLKTTVDGAALKTLLQKVPYPSADGKRPISSL